MHNICVFLWCRRYIRPFITTYPTKSTLFCYHKHSMSYSILSKYTNPRKDESEWVFDYSKWTEYFVLCIYPYSMLGNDMHNKLIQGWGQGKWKRWQHFVLNLLARLAVPRQPFASSSLSPLKHCPDSDGDSYKSNLEKCNNGKRSTQGSYNLPWIDSFHFLFLASYFWRCLLNII